MTKKIDLVEKAVKEQKPKEKYVGTLAFNDSVFNFKTNDLITTLMELKPLQFKSHVKLTVKDGKTSTGERLLLSNLAKLTWRNKTMMEAFVSRLIFK